MHMPQLRNVCFGSAQKDFAGNMRQAPYFLLWLKAPLLTAAGELRVLPSPSSRHRTCGNLHQAFLSYITTLPVLHLFLLLACSRAQGRLDLAETAQIQPSANENYGKVE